MADMSLAEWLRAQDDEMLVELLRARPDLATPSPADTTVLATRAGVRASVARACDDLDTFTLAVLEALLVHNADTASTSLLAVKELLGARIPVARVRQAIEVLRGRVLVWGHDDGLFVVPAAGEVVSAFPGGLGRSSPQLAERDIGQLIEGLGEAERRLLDVLAQGPPLGRTKDAARMVPLERAETPVQRLLAMGLLLHRDSETVELPREVGLTLRGDRPLGAVQFDEPTMGTTAAEIATVDSAAASEALELVRHIEGLIRLWSEEPPSVLRSRGLGVRELRRVTRELGTDERRTALLVELVVAADLVADSEGTEPEWVPTNHADIWLAAGSHQRWATLAAAWLELPRLPGLVGMRDERERLLGPLTDDLRRPLAPRERQRVLDVLAQLPVGTGITRPDEVATVLAWRAPRHGGRLRDDIVRWTLAEAAALGITALGALSSAGRTLLTESPAQAAKRMYESLPEPVDEVLVQADLTIVAPGPLERELADEIALVADVESAGSATVYRVGEATVRRALDAGRTATELHELFRSRSRTPIPQSLTYLIDDAARRHGRLRGGMAGSFLRCDDPVLLSEVLAHSVADRLELRRIAPTVLVSPHPLAEVLDGLRGAGFAPAAENADGTVLDLRPSGRRILGRSRAAQRPTSPNSPSSAAISALVQQIRSGDRVAMASRGVAVRPGGSTSGASTTLALLQGAARANRSVWIGLVDSHGVASHRIVDPVSVGGGVLEGFDQAHGAMRRFPLHRITSAALVEEAQSQ